MKIYKWVQISSNDQKKKKNRSDNKENDQSLDAPFGDDSNTCKLIDSNISSDSKTDSFNTFCIFRFFNCK